jgi:hypothetical protein
VVVFNEVIEATEDEIVTGQDNGWQSMDED